jgi:signal transduction histidine kinase
MPTASDRTTDLSDPTPRFAPRLVVPALYLAAMTVYALALHFEKVRLPLGPAARQAATFWLSLALVMAALAAWTRRVNAPRPTLVRAVLRELVLAVVALGVWQGLIVLINWYFLGPYLWRAYSTWMFQGLFDGAIYGSVRGLMLVTDFWRDQRARERREAALVVAARDAELAAIKTQFQPHFVLNALTSTLALIDHDPALARTMILRLADLMRSVFERSDVDEVPLERELDLARAYLDVERIRLGSRLTVRFEIEDAARGVLVPPFLLQPLVENAVKHGVAPFAHPGIVSVAAEVVRDRLRLTVADNGLAGRQVVPVSPSPGVGLQITRRRLETVYGDGFALTFDRQPNGMVVHLDLPTDIPRVA